MVDDHDVTVFDEHREVVKLVVVANADAIQLYKLAGSATLTLSPI